MRFTLTYDGDLPAQTAHDGRIDVKHRIREAFHDQLCELWNERTSLRECLANYRMLRRQYGNVPWHYEQFEDPLPDFMSAQSGPAALEALRDLRQARIKGIAVPHGVGPFTFLPLATKRHHLVCDLDILFLRAEPPGSLFTNTAGDLDNRLKVLFDALRVPTLGELPPTAQPTERQEPFFCLLDDDKLITTIRVETERLLDEQQKGSRVQLVVRVTLKARRVSLITLDLEGD